MVFDDPAGGVEFFAEGVGGGPVFVLLGLPALLGEFLNGWGDFGVGRVGQDGKLEAEGVEDAVEHSLKGFFNEKGEMVLKKFSNGEQTATLKLSVSISATTITWSGLMITNEGKSYQVKFRREK